MHEEENHVDMEVFRPIQEKLLHKIVTDEDDPFERKVKELIADVWQSRI